MVAGIARTFGLSPTLGIPAWLEKLDSDRRLVGRQGIMGWLETLDGL